MTVHRMDLEADNGREQLFVCPVEGCGRRIVLNDAEMVVIDRGDFNAEHSGGNITITGLQVEQ